METLDLITQLEGDLKAAVKLVPLSQQPENWRLEVSLFYGGEAAGRTSFNLHGYTRDEAEEAARNIKSNPFVMREIDEFLWGESD